MNNIKINPKQNEYDVHTDINERPISNCPGQTFERPLGSKWLRQVKFVCRSACSPTRFFWCRYSSKWWPTSATPSTSVHCTSTSTAFPNPWPGNTPGPSVSSSSFMAWCLCVTAEGRRPDNSASSSWGTSSSAWYPSLWLWRRTTTTSTTATTLMFSGTSSRW